MTLGARQVVPWVRDLRRVLCREGQWQLLSTHPFKLSWVPFTSLTYPTLLWLLRTRTKWGEFLSIPAPLTSHTEIQACCCQIICFLKRRSQNVMSNLLIFKCWQTLYIFKKNTVQARENFSLDSVWPQAANLWPLEWSLMTFNLRSIFPVSDFKLTLIFSDLIRSYCLLSCPPGLNDS